MTPSRAERLCRASLFELRYRFLAKLVSEHQHDRTMVQKQLAELAMMPNIQDVARRALEWHVAARIHGMIYKLVAQVTKDANMKDVFGDIDSTANKVWELFTSKMFGRGSWTKAEAMARILLYETSCFLRVSAFTVSEKQEFVNYYARECSLDDLLNTIFCDKFETILFQTFNRLRGAKHKTNLVHSGLFDEVWSIYRKLLRQYRHDVCVSPQAVPVHVPLGGRHVANS